VDVVGMSTGGSIAQQLAADHPATVRRLGLISTAGRCASAEDGFDLAGCSSAVRAPTLLVGAGGRDRFYPAELFRQTVALIPDARLAYYPRRGHLSVCWDRRAQAVLAGFFR